MEKLPYGTEDYKLIGAFIDSDLADSIAEYSLSNAEVDSRDNYQVLGLFGPEVYSTREAKYSFDSNERIYDAVDAALEIIKESYELKGALSLSRCYVNIMHEGAELDVHTDQDLNVETGVKSYIAGLFLTDNYKGGELFFPNIDTEIKPNKGDLVIFPGHCTAHGVREVKKGSRVNILAIIHETLPE